MELQKTKTGEYTIYIPSMDETYHSRNGALSESQHVFLKEGLDRIHSNIQVLEVGFGTGLNGMLTAQYAGEKQRSIFYHTLEPFQVPFELVEQIGYGKLLNDPELFNKLHHAEWEAKKKISEYFTLHKTIDTSVYFSMRLHQRNNRSYGVLLFFKNYIMLQNREAYLPRTLLLDNLSVT
jgi:hypothetical protein